MGGSPTDRERDSPRRRSAHENRYSLERRDEGDAVVDRRAFEAADDPGALDRALAVVTYLGWNVWVLRHGPTGTVIAFIEPPPEDGKAAAMFSRLRRPRTQ